MLERLAVRGIAKSEIETKLLGGSDMFDMFDMSEGRSRSVGRQNAETALSMLEGGPCGSSRRTWEGGAAGRSSSTRTPAKYS